jgi:benzoyl-CoA reductase/2-hydroxyglutaryl-CoA dehydratase subunit BcrC/BadD/HgdB
MAKGRKKLEIARRVWPLMKDYFAKARQAKQEKKLVGWTFGIIPLELLHAVGVVPLTSESFSSLLSSKDQITEYLDLATQTGLPTTACPVHLATIGYLFSGKEQMIPKPDFILGSSMVCDTAVKNFQIVRNYLEVPSYFLDAPFITAENEENLSLSIDALLYYELQIKEFISFIEELTKQPIDEERFKKTFKLAAQTNSLWEEISQLRRSIPCPMGALDEISAMYPLLQLRGTEEAVGFFQILLAEVKQRVANNQGIIEEEKYRLLWLGPSPGYDSAIFNYFEEFGAVLVKTDMDQEHMVKGLDPYDPIGTLAKGMIMNPFNGSLSRQINLTKRLIEDYQIAGIVVYASLGCQIYGGEYLALIESIKKELGLPLLLLKGNLMDFRDYREEETRRKIRSFIEKLE